MTVNTSWSMFITFGVLAASICAVWLKPIPLGKRRSVPPWTVIFAASVASGLVAGYLTWQAIGSLGIFGVIAYASKKIHTKHPFRPVLLFTTGAMALALSMHKFPGFSNPVVVENMRFSANGTVVTRYLSFDTISAGIILLAFFCDPARRATEWKPLARRTLSISAVTLLSVLGLALLIGYVEPDFKIPPYTVTFLITNLLFTCVTEEAFFRGFMQEQLMRGMNGLRGGTALAAAISAVLFGIAHAKGGALLVLLATVAGVHYAYAYLSTRRVEAAIMTHFTLNSVHFIAFTYPSLIKSTTPA